MQHSSSVHHIMSHELKGLESFIAQGLLTLPKLTAEASTKTAYQTCSVYHTKCSGLLREVLHHVQNFSPKHCKLIAEIWDVASVNVLMLLKVCQATVQERIQVKDDFAQFNRFSQKCAADDAAQLNALTAANESLKSELREAKAEIQTTQRKLTRAVFEKERLEKILDRVTSATQGTLGDGIDSDDDDEMAAEGFLIQHSDVAYQEATPLEIVVDDIDKLYVAVESENQRQLATLGELDRSVQYPRFCRNDPPLYIDSNLVSILWKHQAPSHRNGFAEKMFRTDVKTTQTDESLLLGLGDDDGVTSEADELLQSPRMRKKILAIPLGVRAMLDTVPKVHKMLAKRSLTHLIVSLYVLCFILGSPSPPFVNARPRIWYLRKADAERTKPNIPFPQFLRDYFLYKFGLKSLTDFHMVETVKSCIYYRRKLDNFAGLYDADKSGCNLPWDDARIFLFGRILNVFPDEPLCSYLHDEGLSIILDFLADVIEVDTTIPSLHHIQDADGPVSLHREAVVFVWKCHFSYMGPETLDKVEYDLNEHQRDESPQQLDMDWTLSYIAYQWSEFEVHFDLKIRAAFRTVLMSTSSNRTNLLLQMDGFVAAVQAVWPDCNDNDMENLYMDMMATKRENFRLASERRKREKLRSTKTKHVAATTVLGIDGVFEEEFVAQVGKLLRCVDHPPKPQPPQTPTPHTCRARRVKWGIRTRGQLLWSTTKDIWIGGQGRASTVGFQEHLLKPGVKL
ncbi:Aste57867_18315 [Aphanomyces stellatus]|uniref:Aste57867_18315 protein n=1 Tax=Aphanomyces stellatus TaxID=120398 RepID=A0A485LBH4_9STRA|nr:hypothetical protein As57867_018253 [Aphanomyces stellatus]VFT95051.1 Aste57867_18315 [Aphanomyces stellatus]